MDWAHLTIAASCEGVSCKEGARKAFAIELASTDSTNHTHTMTMLADLSLRID